MSIIIVEKGRKARRLDPHTVDRENYLQEYVQNNPETLPVEELKPGAKLLVIDREFPSDSGPIDALAIDDDGDIYIVETKLAKNPDKRRVIAQMLDYGAALWNAGAESFLAAARRNGDLGEKIAEVFAMEDDAEVKAVMTALRANVETGRFYFVVLMNQLDERLKTLISFVNSNSRFTILGLELDFYTHGDIDILIPHLYGAEARKPEGTEKTRGHGRAWTEAAFFEEAQQTLSSDQLERVKELYEWALRRGVVRFSTTIGEGAFNVAFPDRRPERFFKVKTDVPHLDLVPLGPALRDELLKRGIVTSPDKKKPTVPMEEWGWRLPDFITALETIIIRSSE